MRFISFLSLALLSATVIFAAIEPPHPLAVGERLPDVNLQTEQGQSVTLASLVTRPTVLIFYRGGWCPFCNRHLAALAENQEAILATGAQVIAISPDRPEILRQKPALQKLPYQLLSDSAMTAAQAFGIAFKVEDAVVAKYKDSYKIDLEASAGATHHLLPHPAVFIVDAGGVIRFAHVNPDYKVRLEPAKVLAALTAVVGQP